MDCQAEYRMASTADVGLLVREHLSSVSSINIAINAISTHGIGLRFMQL